MIFSFYIFWRFWATNRRVKKCSYLVSISFPCFLMLCYRKLVNPLRHNTNFRQPAKKSVFKTRWRTKKSTKKTGEKRSKVEHIFLNIFFIKNFWEKRLSYSFITYWLLSYKTELKNSKQEGKLRTNQEHSVSLMNRQFLKKI